MPFETFGVVSYSQFIVTVEWLGYRVMKKVWQCQAVSIEYRNVTDGWTDRQT